MSLIDVGLFVLQQIGFNAAVFIVFGVDENVIKKRIGQGLCFDQNKRSIALSNYFARFYEPKKTNQIEHKTQNQDGCNQQINK